MSVKRISQQDASEIIARAQSDAIQVKKNFYEIFGSTNCLLNCGEGLDLEQDPTFVKTNEGVTSREGRRNVRSTRRECVKNVLQSHKEWFSAVEIETSIAKGCGACNILREILRELFPGNQHGLSGAYDYSITYRFALKRRLTGMKESVETIQLFRPRGSSVPLKYFFDSDVIRDCKSSISRISQWLSECMNTHQNCANYSVPQAAHNQPMRLLDLTPLQHGGRSGIKLIETKAGSTYRYACLSHRWDTAVTQHQTTLNNLQDRLTFLELDTLPANFRDGILIARGLGVGYVWIDSICIIQEGDSDADKTREIAKMGSIYSNAIITIAAVAAKTSSDGCFIKDKWSDICLVATDSKNEEYLMGARVLDMKGVTDSPASIEETYPLLKRGWVLQERLLSPRLLQCNYGEFTFECLEASRCECRSSSIPPHLSAGSQRFDKVNFHRRKQLFVQSKGARDSRRDTALIYWKSVVRTYMQLRLTETSDALPAVAGLAQYLSRYIESDYVAGLWKEFLPTEMLWFATPVVQRLSPKSRPKGTTAPSWSWASVAMGPDIGYMNSNRSENFPKSQKLLEFALKEICCEPESTLNPFGKLKLAYLKLHTILYPWYLRVFCDKSGTHRYRNRKDLYTHIPNPTTKCQARIEGLPIYRARVDLYFDAKQKDEGSEFEPFDYCVDGLNRPCALAPVSLLHALHRESLQSSIDVFLVLLRIIPQHGKSNCYKRIGLMKLEMDGPDRRSWEEMVDGKIAQVREEFWLF